MQQVTTPRESAQAIAALRAILNRRAVADLIRRKAMQQHHRPGR